jgi:pseudaminic acid biosynthesis-associated methylase
MKNKSLTPQEIFWSGDFGNEYILRNQSSQLLAANLALFTSVLKCVDSIPLNFLELGPNVGMNIRALQLLCPNSKFSGIEINKKACEELRKMNCQVIEGSVSEVVLDEKFDCVLSKGLLIHINSDQLGVIYEKIYNWSTKYILIAEYYNPVPISIGYRGHNDKLFKRDFAGELIDKYPDLILKDYGFVYHRDIFPLDDISWFLFEKKFEK